MKTSAYIYLLCSIVGTLLSTSSVVAKKNENDVSTDKIRAGYMSTKDIDILPVMAQNGMNTAIFKNESGKVLGRYDIFTNQTVSVPLGHSSYGEIIELSIKPRSRVYFEDVYIRVESGLEKYISPVREAVVKASLR